MILSMSVFCRSLYIKIIIYLEFRIYSGDYSFLPLAKQPVTPGRNETNCGQNAPWLDNSQSKPDHSIEKGNLITYKEQASNH